MKIYQKMMVERKSHGISGFISKWELISDHQFNQHSLPLKILRKLK